MEDSRPTVAADDALLDAVALGDRRAFDTIYERTAPAVARFAWSLSESREVAEDLLQETFLTAWRKHESIQVVNGSALPWLLATCRNHSRNRARRDRRQREILAMYEESLATDPVNGSAATQLRTALDAIERLPELDRRVCELCLLQGFTYREASQQLGISEASVGKRLHRARQDMRKEAH